MGNTVCSCEWCCCLPCLEVKKEETVIEKQVYKSVFDYPSNSLSDRKLKKGDILEVIEEKENWVYARRCTAKGDKKEFFEEQVYVPKDFLKPVNSMEAQP